MCTVEVELIWKQELMFEGDIKTGFVCPSVHPDYSWWQHISQTWYAWYSWYACYLHQELGKVWNAAIQFDRPLHCVTKAAAGLVIQEWTLESMLRLLLYVVQFVSAVNHEQCDCSFFFVPYDPLYYLMAYNNFTSMMRWSCCMPWSNKVGHMGLASVMFVLNNIFLIDTEDIFWINQKRLYNIMKLQLGYRNGNKTNLVEQMDRWSLFKTPQIWIVSK